MFGAHSQRAGLCKAPHFAERPWDLIPDFFYGVVVEICWKRWEGEVLCGARVELLDFLGYFEINCDVCWCG